MTPEKKREIGMILVIFLVSFLLIYYDYIEVTIKRGSTKFPWESEEPSYEEPKIRDEIRDEIQEGTQTTIDATPSIDPSTLSTEEQIERASKPLEERGTFTPEEKALLSAIDVKQFDELGEIPSPPGEEPSPEESTQEFWFQLK